jgi:cation transporter/ATPase, N-terminus
MLFYNLSTDEVLKKSGSRREGLTANEVKKRQKKFGENIIKLRSEPLW